MKTSKILLAAVAGTIVMFLLGWLVYGILLMDFFQNSSEMVEGSHKDPMIMWALVAGHFFYALLLAIIFGRWANISTFSTGAIAGSVIGFLLTVGIDLFMYSMMVGHTLTTIVVDAIVSPIILGITGGVIALVLGRGK